MYHFPWENELKQQFFSLTVIRISRICPDYAGPTDSTSLNCTQLLLLLYFHIFQPVLCCGSWNRWGTWEEPGTPNTPPLRAETNFPGVFCITVAPELLYIPAVWSTVKNLIKKKYSYLKARTEGYKDMFEYEYYWIIRARKNAGSSLYCNPSLQEVGTRNGPGLDIS